MATQIVLTLSSVADGALFDLGCYGPEKDITCMNPVKTFFTQVGTCQRHTNFAFAEADFAPEEGAAAHLTWFDGTVLNGKMPRQGDLTTAVFFRFGLTALSIPADTYYNPDEGTPSSPAYTQFIDPRASDLYLYWCEEVGNAMVREAELIVGQQTASKITSEGLHVLHDNKIQEGRLLKFSNGRFTNGVAYTNEQALRNFAAMDRQLYVPLPLMCQCGPMENAFPHIIINQQEIRYKVTLRGRNQLIVAYYKGINGFYPLNSQYVYGGQLANAGFTAVVAFLDSPEQKAFASQPVERYYEYMENPAKIRVVAGSVNPITFANLPFNNAVTELYVLYRETQRLNMVLLSAAPSAALNPAGNPIAPLSAPITTAPQLSYFDFSTDTPAYYQPGAFDPTGAYIGGIVQPENPIVDMTLSVNGSTARVSRQGVYWSEIGTFLRGTRIMNFFGLVHKFAAYPDEENMFSGASILGNSQITPLTINLLYNNNTGSAQAPAIPSAIGQEAEIIVIPRAQGFYKITGGQLGMRWVPQ